MTLPHLTQSLVKTSGDASYEMRAWMESIDQTASRNDAYSRGFVFVSSVEDLPEAVSGVITLLDSYTYYFTTVVDLEGSRLVCGQNTVILGSSSENSRIKSTGLSGALITSQYSLPIRHIALEAATIFDLDANGNPDQALDWYGVNLVGSSDIGTIADYSNFVVGSMAFLGSSGLVFDGSIGTIAFSNSLFVGTDPGTIITLPATLTVSRRFRIIYSAFVVTGSGVGINASTSATIPVEGYILDTVNFSGGGTYLSGIQYDDNKARFDENRGVLNSAAITGYYMQGNATATVISATNTPVKVAGTTTEYSISQKFTHSNNRSTYTGEIDRDFKVTSIQSLTSGNGHQIGVYIAKNGVVINESETYLTTNASGRLENGTVQTIVSLTQNDYIEIFVENNTAVTNVTVEDLNVITEALN